MEVRFATTGLMQCSKKRLYPMTSSARASDEGVTVMSSALAVLRLITSSNVVGWKTGSSVGFTPLRT
jgi:hypothetical protein